MWKINDDIKILYKQKKFQKTKIIFKILNLIIKKKIKCKKKAKIK